MLCRARYAERLSWKTLSYRQPQQPHPRFEDLGYFEQGRPQAALARPGTDETGPGASPGAAGTERLGRAQWTDRVGAQTVTVAGAGFGRDGPSQAETAVPAGFGRDSILNRGLDHGRSRVHPHMSLTSGMFHVKRDRDIPAFDTHRTSLPFSGAKRFDAPLGRDEGPTVLHFDIRKQCRAIRNIELR